MYISSDSQETSSDQISPMSSPSKSGPLQTRTKSLRERFGSKRSYSENFKDPPIAATTSPSKEGCRAARPSLPAIQATIPIDESKDPQKIYNPYAQPQTLLQQQVLQQQQQQQQKRQQMNVLSEHYNPFAVLPEETYCSALDINSQEGDPRFPWQRDAAVQCDMSPDPEGLM